MVHTLPGGWKEFKGNSLTLLWGIQGIVLNICPNGYVQELRKSTTLDIIKVCEELIA